MKVANNLSYVRKAAEISTKILKEVYDATTVGVSAFELNELAEKLCVDYGVKPAFKNYAPQDMPPFPSSLSVCVNDEVVHGFATREKVIRSGDIVTLDFGVIHQGYYSDHCVSIGIGEVSEKLKKLLEVSKLAVLNSTKLAKPGGHTGDLGYAMQSVSELAGYEVVREYIGHGIGRSLHEEPELPAYGREGKGEILKKDMVLCVEAQIVDGSARIRTDADKWTVRTKNGDLCSWFEYMVIVADKPEIITPTQDWPIIKS